MNILTPSLLLLTLLMVSCAEDEAPKLSATLELPSQDNRTTSQVDILPSTTVADNQLVNISADADQANFLRNYADHIVWLEEDNHINSVHTLSDNPDVIVKEPWLSPSTKHSGTHSLALYLAKNASAKRNSTERNEIAYVRTADRFSDHWESLRFTSFKFKLGAGKGKWDFETPSENLLIFQVWQECGKNGNPSYSPIVSLEIDPLEDSNQVLAQVYTRSEGYHNYNTGSKIAEFKIPKYQWQEFRMALTPSTSKKGQIEIWLNDKLIAEEKNINIGLDPEKYPGTSTKVAYKAGLYRLEQNSSHLIFLDEIKFADRKDLVD